MRKRATHSPGVVAGAVALASIAMVGFDAVALVPLTDVVRVAAGSLQSCALLATGEVKCWGRNHQGELGNGSNVSSKVALTTHGVPMNAVDVAAGDQVSCAVTGAGGVKCWGYNYYYQLGNATKSDAWSPIEVAGLSSGMTAVATGGAHACAVTAVGGVKCWGTGALGQGTVPGYTPVDVPGLTGVSAIAAGENHNCALTTGGAVMCWRSTAPADVAGLASGVTAIAASREFSCALAAGGAVKCWGTNSYGQLGNGTLIDSALPVDVAGLASGAIAVTTGWNHACAIAANGGVKCWGYNDDGQLGDGTLERSATPVDVIGLPSGATQVSAGATHTCARTPSAQVRCWGRNDIGQLGNGTTEHSPTPVGVVTAAACAAFTDVQPADPFCRHVEWIRNRLVTRGCDFGVYCPSSEVDRLSMAAFMNRFGNHFSPWTHRTEQQVSGPLDPGLAPVVCKDYAFAADEIPRRVHLDGVFTAIGTADVDLAIEFVVSTDSGVTWVAATSQLARSAVFAGRWTNLRLLAHYDAVAGQTVVFAIRVGRGNGTGTATIAGSTCNLRARHDNRDGVQTPF